MSTDVQSPAPDRRLSGVDAAFLYFERNEIPLHIAAVGIFDGPIPLDKFVADMESKVRLIPRYTQIAVAPPMDIGYPTWEPDPRFDVRRHIFQTRLRSPGGEAELEALAGEVLGRVMDRNKPLWDIHVVDGLAGGRGALIVRIHHSVADGVSGVELLEAMLRPAPGRSRAAAKTPVLPPQQPSDLSLTAAIGSAVHTSLGHLLDLEVGVLEFGQALFSDRMQQGLKGLLSLLPELAAAVERLPFNKPCGSQRTFCWGEFDLEHVKAIRAAAGSGTLNDVVLATLTRAIAKYVKLHGETSVNRFLRVVCPVSLRNGSHQGTLGNRISFLPIALPMDVRDPLEMVRAAAFRSETMKSVRTADLVALVASWFGSAPPPVQAAMWRSIPYVTFPLPLFNIICTNVAGSTVPLYAAGRRMIASYPHVPTGYEMGVGCAVQSYDGKLFFGLTADAQAAPDATRLRDFIKTAFAELCRAAGVKKSSDRRAAPPKARERRAKPAAAAAKTRRIPARRAESAPPPATAQPVGVRRASPAPPAEPTAPEIEASAEPAPPPPPVVEPPPEPSPEPGSAPRKVRARRAKPAPGTPPPIAGPPDGQPPQADTEPLATATKSGE